MSFAFDLISDLHVESWGSLDWTGQATSPFCVVAGDVARDTKLVVDTLTHLAQCYQAVFYIDGNDEHRYHLENDACNYSDIKSQLKHIHNLVYMHENVVVIDGVALLATNGWWSYDMSLEKDAYQTQLEFQAAYSVSEPATERVQLMAYHDAAYLINSVKLLQTHPDVRSIVMVTHTVPAPWLIEHDISLTNSWRFNTTGNPHMELALNEDSENKIHTWCFGHYHQPVDRFSNGVRYVNNCRGRKGTDWCQTAYYPKRIEIDF